MLAIDDRVEGEIVSLAFGGEGILRHDNFVIFVPFTAIGDRIICRIQQVKSSYAKAECVEVITPSPSRAQPLCPYYGRCGGCQLQHLQPTAQLAYKYHVVIDALKRIGHLEPPSFEMNSAEEKWAYRRHITLHIKPKANGFEAGYIGQDSHSLVVIQTCPIFNELDHPILKNIQEWLQLLPNPQKVQGRLMVLKNHRDQFILYFKFDAHYAVDKQVLETLLKTFSSLAGVIVQNPLGQIIVGDPYSEEKVDNLIFRFTPETFIQNHADQSANIYRQIDLLASQYPSQNILDLYCGFGMTSLMLAQSGHCVTGIEFNPQAIRFARENAQLNFLKNVEFVQGDVEKELPRVLNKRVDMILMNPPRQGVTKNIIHTLLKSQVRTLIYVSCMPATLARDLEMLKSKFKIISGKIYDMFPQTAHVETLVHLQRAL